jgi:hypothetical protein
MGKRNRQDTKNDKSSSELIRKFKGIINKLEKEVRQLRRELGRRLDATSDYQDLIHETQPLPNITPTPTCPDCGNSTSEIDLGKFVIIKCNECFWKTRKK